MTYNFTIVINPEAIESGLVYVARAIELGVVSQGSTLEEAKENLKQAIELYLEDEPVLNQSSKSVAAPLITTMSIEHA